MPWQGSACTLPPRAKKSKGFLDPNGTGVMGNPFPRDQIKHIKLYGWDDGSGVGGGLYVKEEAYPVLLLQSHSKSNSKPRAVHDIQRH